MTSLSFFFFQPDDTTSMELHDIHGFNIVLGEGRRSARRISSYNQGVVLTSRPVVPNKVLQVIKELSPVYETYYFPLYLRLV